MSMVPASPPQAARYLERVAALAPAFAAARDYEENARELSPELVAAMHHAGLFRMLLPTFIGGGALDPLSYTRVVEEIAKHDASAAWCVNQGSGCSMTAGYLSPEAARDVFGQPNDVLAWGPSPGATARAVDGGYVVNYRGNFASGSRHATWLGALCLVEEADGSPRLNAQGRQEMRTLVYPKTQAKVLDTWRVVGLRGTGSDSFVLEDLYVPDAHTALRDEPGRECDSSLHYRYSSLMVYSSGFGHVALGIARGVMDAFCELAGHKTPRDTPNVLRDKPVVQAEIAQCEAQWQSARHYLRASIADAWDFVQTEIRPTVDHRMAVRLAATHAIHAAKEVVDTLYDAAGASAIFEGGPFERRFRDIHTVTQQLQGRKSHFENVGRFILGLSPELTYW